MDSFRAFTAKHVFIILIVIVAVAFFGSTYALGYRVEPGGFARVGTLTLTNIPSGTAIYIEQTLRTTTTKAGDISLELGPGNHSIIVNAPNNYPWSSLVSITSGQTDTVDPLLVKMNIPVTSLTGAEQATATQAIATSILPTIEAPLTADGGCVHVYVDTNRVVAEAATSTPGCTPPPYLCPRGLCAATIIYAPIAPLANVFIYPGRQDALAVAFSGTLYALALDPSNPQFFAPLVRGAHATFGQLPDGTIVVKDEAIVSKIGL